MMFYNSFYLIRPSVELEEQVEYDAANAPHEPEMYDAPDDSPTLDKPLVYDVPLEDSDVPEQKTLLGIRNSRKGGKSFFGSFRSAAQAISVQRHSKGNQKADKSNEVTDKNKKTVDNEMQKINVKEREKEESVSKLQPRDLTTIEKGKVGKVASLFEGANVQTKEDNKPVISGDKSPTTDSKTLPPITSQSKDAKAMPKGKKDSLVVEKEQTSSKNAKKNVKPPVKSKPKKEKEAEIPLYNNEQDLKKQKKQEKERLKKQEEERLRQQKMEAEAERQRAISKQKAGTACIVYSCVRPS